MEDVVGVPSLLSPRINHERQRPMESGWRPSEGQISCLSL